MKFQRKSVKNIMANRARLRANNCQFFILHCFKDFDIWSGSCKAIRGSLRQFFMSLLKYIRNFYVIFEFCVRSWSQARFTFSLVHTQSISGKAIQFSDRKLFVPTRKNCQSCKSISTSIKGSVAKYLFFLDYLWENCE